MLKVKSGKMMPVNIFNSNRVTDGTLHSEFSISTPVHPNNILQIYNTDAIKLLESMNDGTADVLFLDPPFNLGKSYGTRTSQSDLQSESDYDLFLHRIIEESCRVIAPGGALYLYHLPRWAMKAGQYLSERLLFRHWIAISMKNGFVRGNNLYPAHYALLYYTNGQPSSFNRPKILPKKCRSCGEYLKDYGGYKKFVRNGVNLSDVWDDLSPVRHSKYKNRAENELPLALVSRVLQISGVEGGLLVDPFVGSGTSLVAAVDHNMSFISSDREIACCAVARQRVLTRIAEKESVECGCHI